MMGPAVEDLSYPTTKTTGGLILLSQVKRRPARSRALHPLRPLHRVLPHGPGSGGGQHRLCRP